MNKTDVAQALIARHGETYAEQAGIRLKDKPSPLYQLLVLSTLLSARISADLAVAASTELNESGWRTPQAMRDSTWQERVDALGRGHYRRYDESTATALGQGAELVLDRWNGDLRRIHTADAERIQSELQRVPRIGPTGAAIFCREVQGVWPDISPYVDSRTSEGAKRVGLPTSPKRLMSYADDDTFVHLVAGCVRAALSQTVVEDVTL